MNSNIFPNGFKEMNATTNPCMYCTKTPPNKADLHWASSCKECFPYAQYDLEKRWKLTRRSKADLKSKTCSVYVFDTNKEGIYVGHTEGDIKKRLREHKYKYPNRSGARFKQGLNLMEALTLEHRLKWKNDFDFSSIITGIPIRNKLIMGLNPIPFKPRIQRIVSAVNNAKTDREKLAIGEGFHNAILYWSNPYNKFLQAYLSLVTAKRRLNR